MRLAYHAVDRVGHPVRDVIDAASAMEARERLRHRGLFVTEIAEAATAAPARPRERSRRRSGSVKALANWSRQLCVLVRSGTPLSPALQAIEEQTGPGAWRDVLADVRRCVEEGATLSDTMARHPEIFDDVFRSLVAAGESSGQLGQMLDRAATLARQQLKLRRTLAAAFVYPALLIVVGITVTLVMLLAVLPRFAELFDSLNAPLPATTHLLMSLSAALRSHWWAFLLGAATVVAAIRLATAGPAGRRRIDTLAIGCPCVGRIVRSIGTARIARLLGVLLESRVPLLQALELTARSAGNAHFAALMQTAVESATRGESISSAFTRSTLVNRAVAEAVRHGEQSGQVGPVLRDMADFLDEENEVIVKTAMNLLEPLILICLGVVVAFIALSLFIPLFDLTSTAGAAR
jgi:type II secretory pathway component PulF